MPLATPLDALRLALDKGTFGVETLHVLHDALERFEADAALTMEQVAAARAHARATQLRWRIEDAAFWGVTPLPDDPPLPNPLPDDSNPPERQPR